MRVFLIVLDSVGIGAMPDAAEYGDAGSDTLSAIAKSPKFDVPNLKKLGLFNIEGVNAGEKSKAPLATVARLKEKSKGKDTTIGHWELAGVVSERPFPTYPNGFPPEIINEFERRAGRKTLCNRPYSGTEVIKDFGREHMSSGALIVYTSADSVFQIAAHEDIVPPEELYRYCETARQILSGEHAVGRVIARPFKGEYPDFKRTENRHDFSLAPPATTMLDRLKDKGLDVVGIGKIYDIFAGRGITEKIHSKTNAEGMEALSRMAERRFNGLCFANLVDFDMLYGHRNDIDGYAAALSAFDLWLDGFINNLKEDDMLIITADHGCDPSTPSTDHSREYVPYLRFSKKLPPQNLGTVEGFDFVAKTIELYLNAD
ncbi:MAG TPA: phosphopentomutase [Eubacteriales bacterium]|jgi:phosphopentomutase|nr:phosphopentomutase [Clostridia bacterium]HRR90022.1 phosphopentomutase [Eubacteriales bacterium]HRU84627.1 phosphopentomutase [Eubacteriales bacterium]